MKNRKPMGYGVFLQDGGEMMAPASADQQMAAEQMAMEQGMGGGEDPQMIAQQFLEAFAQIPPEAQQLVMEALMQQ